MTFKNQVFKDRECRICGTSFTPTHPQEAMCSKVCVKVNNNNKRRAHRLTSTRDRDALKKWNDNNPVKTMINAARTRAKNRNLEFNITSEDLVLPTHCPILGLKLSRAKGGKRNQESYALDRIDNTKGYIKGNVHIISDRANRIKNDSTLDELKAIVNYLEELHEKSN